MTILTLMKYDDHIYVMADKEGFIVGDFTMLSAFNTMKAAGYRNPDHISLRHLLDEGEFRYRFYEIDGNFATSVPHVKKALESKSLYCLRSINYQHRYGYRLKEKLGELWYEAAKELE